MIKRCYKKISFITAIVLLISLFAAFALPAAAQSASESSDPLDQYPSYTEWKTHYQPQETNNNYVAHIRITSEAEWLQLVDDTNADKTANPLFTNLNRSVTIHLDTEDGVLDMQNQAMFPLGYNDTGFLAHINGHDQVFENVLISMKNPTRHVGLISTISVHRIYQNFGIASGKIEVTGEMASDKCIGAIAGGVNSSGGKAQAGVLRKIFNNAKIIAKKNAVSGILGQGVAWPVIDGCFNTGWLEVTGTNEEFNGEVGGICVYAGNRIRIHNSFANCPAAYNSISEYRGIGYHGNTYPSGSPMVNCYGAYPFIALVNDFTPQAEADADNAKATTASAQESAYKLNHTYVPVDYAGINQKLSSVFNFNSAYLSMLDTDPIYYTMTETGEIRFGNAENQLRKITIKDRDEEIIKVFYANSNQDLELNYDLGANYFALLSGNGASIRKGKDAKSTLHVGAGDVEIKVAYDVEGGDIDGNNIINLMDAITVLRASIDLDASVNDPLSGDVNFNGRLDANDAVLIVHAWLGDTSLYNPADYPIEDKSGWLKVASYNVKSLVYCPDPASRHDDYWAKLANNEPGFTVDYTSQYQADECAQILRSADAVLVGLQEIHRESSTSAAHDSSCTRCYDNTKILASLSNYPISHMAYDAYSRTTSSGHYRDNGSGILSKVQVTAPEENVYFAAQYGSEQRMYTRYTISGRELTAYGFPADSTLVWYNSHTGNYTRQQMAQLGAAMEADYAKGYYVVATADFNQNPISFNDCTYGDYSFDIKTSHFTMANGGKLGKITNGERQQIDNILISDNLEFYWDPATQNALYRIDCDTLEDFTPDHSAGAQNAPTKDGLSFDTTLEYASDHSLVYAYIRPKIS